MSAIWAASAVVAAFYGLYQPPYVGVVIVPNKMIDTISVPYDEGFYIGRIPELPEHKPFSDKVRLYVDVS